MDVLLPQILAIKNGEVQWHTTHTVASGKYHLLACTRVLEFSDCHGQALLNSQHCLVLLDNHSVNNTASTVNQLILATTNFAFLVRYVALLPGIRAIIPRTTIYFFENHLFWPHKFLTLMPSPRVPLCGA